jgi:hypothetical protein
MAEMASDSSLSKDKEVDAFGIHKVEVSLNPDSSSNSFGGAKLNGNNYRMWKKMMTAHLCGLNKMGYVNGTIPVPTEDSDDYCKWENNNGAVMSVLYKSMTEDVVQLIIGCDTALEIWITLKDLYLNESDFAQIHELHCKAFKMTQNGQAVSIFYTQLKNIWAEIDQRRPNKMKNAEDIAFYQAEKDLLRVHIFLNGLDSKHDSAKGELLRLATPPSLIQAFSYIRKDESQQTSAKAVQSEISSLTIQSKTALHPQPMPPKFLHDASTSKVVCAHCKWPGHSKEKCYKLIGYPPGYFDKPKSSRSKGKAAVQLVQEPDYYGVAGQDHPIIAAEQSSVAMIGRGKIGMALQISSFISEDTWIIDSGASDHMTYDKSYFTHLSAPLVSSVTNANGEAFPVLGKGSIRVTPSLELHNVLYVPALSHHLISVPQLNSQSKCSVTFFPMYALFQDLHSKEIIGRGYLRGGAVSSRPDVCRGESKQTRPSCFDFNF